MGHNCFEWIVKINDCMCWFSCLILSGEFGYMEFVENLLLMLKFHCWYMICWLLWEFSLNWWKWWCCCWLILNSWFICCEYGWVNVCVENSWQWLRGVDMLKWIEWNSCFELLCFGEESFGRKSGFWTKHRFKHFCELSYFGCFELS
jgi:hypothetical protein